MTLIHKDYQQPFLLEPTKLTRLVDLIHDRLASHQHTTTSDHFEVTLSGNRREEMTSIDEVLALENSRKQMIKRLLIISSATTEGAIRPEHEIQVDFAANKSDRSTTTVIAVSVRSDNTGWASRTLSEVEEQVERTWLPYLPSILMLLGLVCVLVVVVLLQFPMAVGLDRAQTMWLRGPDIERVEKILNQGDAISDDEMRQITNMQLRNVLEDYKAKQSPAKWRSGQWIFLAAVVVVLGCMITLLTACYPSSVFLWGDEIERHAEMVHRRRITWSILVGVMLVGVLSRAFSESVVSLFP